MNCELWENLKNVSLFDYSYCKITGARCYCNGVKENCDYNKEEDETN